MSSSFDFTRLRKLITIYTVVQVFFALLLVAFAFWMQQKLGVEGRPQRFFHSIFISIGIQLALFYPLSRGAMREVNREVESSTAGLDAEQMKALRNRRMFADIIKSAVFLFFAAFITTLPQDTFFLSIALFTYLLTFLSYSQYFTLGAKRKIKELT